MSDRTLIILPMSGAGPYIPQAIGTIRQPIRPPATRLSADRDHIARAGRNDADRTTPIASAARGSVQSGFNDVALGAHGVVGVARPHRSLQIPCTLLDIVDVSSINTTAGHHGSTAARHRYFD